MTQSRKPFVTPVTKSVLVPMVTSSSEAFVLSVLRAAKIVCLAGFVRGVGRTTSSLTTMSVCVLRDPPVALGKPAQLAVQLVPFLSTKISGVAHVMTVIASLVKVNSTTAQSVALDLRSPAITLVSVKDMWFLALVTLVNSKTQTGTGNTAHPAVKIVPSATTTSAQSAKIPSILQMERVNAQHFQLSMVQRVLVTKMKKRKVLTHSNAQMVSTASQQAHLSVLIASPAVKYARIIHMSVYSVLLRESPPQLGFVIA